MRGVPGNPAIPGVRADLRLRLGVLALVAAAACGEAEPTVVPIAAVPFGEPGGQCVDVFAEAFPAAQGCLYFEGAPCVLVADLEAAHTEGCASDGACNLAADSWMKHCPEGAPEYDTETEAGQRVPARLFVVVSSAASGVRPEFCSLEPPAACNGSSDPEQGTTGCLARIDLAYRVNEATGAFEPDEGEPAQLSYSGFALEELGRWGGDDPICPSIEAETCPPEAASCNPVDLELLRSGSARGRLQAVPRGERCEQDRCTLNYPQGRTVMISAAADSGAVIAEFSSALGAADGCMDLFTTTTTTATCAVTLSGDGQVTADFGYALTVGVNGQGEVTGTPGGVDGDGIDCRSGACTEIYSEDVAVVLSANETQVDWQFSSWMGGPCDGERSATCTVQMDQAHTVTAQFGFRLELEVVGDGQITATPPGVACDAGSSPCVVTYRKDDVTTLTVSPGVNSVFEGWGGACANEGASPSCTVTLDVEKSVVARFAYEVQSVVQGGGTLTRVPAGGACASLGPQVCGSYLPDQPVSFTAAPDPEWIFLDWTGCSAPAGTLQCGQTITEAVTVRSRFGRQLDVVAAGEGSIDITAPVRGDCGAGTVGSCTGGYADGATVTLTAMPASGWAVQANSWQGCTPMGADPTRCTVSMDGARAVNLTFGRRLLFSAGAGGRVTSSPTGIDCGADCDEVFPDGTGVTLTAVPDTGWAFEAWTGCTPSAQDPAECSLSMDAARTVAASFGRDLQVSVLGGGVVQSTPGGIACSDSGGACNQTFADASSVTLDATPAAGWAFLGWGPNCTPDAVIPTRCTVSLAAARTITATFGRQLSVSTVGMGSVTLDGAGGLACPGDCDEVIADGTQVVLRATPSAGWALVAFTGCDSVATDTCTVSMNQARTVSATFGRELVVTTVGGGQVISNPAGISCSNGAGDCSEAYTSGSLVTLDAAPGTGRGFLSWSGCTPDASIPTRCTVTMSAARAVTASFGLELTVGVAGDGSVASSLGGINCGTDCLEVYAAGTTVTLNATPVAPAQFGGWTGCRTESGTQCTVLMNVARTVTASFGAGVTVAIADGQGSVQSSPVGISCPGDCNEVYNNNQSVRLDATPTAGWVVRDWAGCVQDAGNPNRCTLTATGGGQAVTVRFGRQLSVAVTGRGTVNSVPPGIACAADCDEVYANNTAITLTAAPDAGWAFLSWFGCTPVAGSSEQCTTTMSQARTVSATFGRQLDITTNGNGATSTNPIGVSCGAGCTIYPTNTVVTITAAPSAAWALLGWSGCVPQADPLQCQVTMGTARSVILDFGRRLDVTVAGQGSVSSNPPGISCGADCTEVFDDGQNVVLTAAPSAGYDIATWSGCTPVVGNPRQCSTTLASAGAVSASFEPILTVNAPTALAGETVVSNPAGISCVGPACVETSTFPANASVVLTASPGAGRVVTWSGCTVAADPNQCTVSMSGPQTVDVQFLSTLTVNAPTQQAGETISSNPAGISCAGANCTDTAAFGSGSTITLTASPGAGRVVAWTGCNVAGNPEVCTLTLNAPTTVTAIYTTQRTLTVSAPASVAGESITSSPVGINCAGAACSDSAQFTDGTLVSLTASPGANRTVAQWTGCTVSGVNASVCDVTLTANTAVTADIVDTFTLNVTFAGAGLGRVDFSLGALGGETSCNANCIVTFMDGDVVALTPVPDGGSAFTSFVGDCTGGTCSLTMDQDRALTATFD